LSGGSDFDQRNGSVALQNTDTRLTGASPYSVNLHPAKCRPGIRVEFGARRNEPRASLALQGAAKLTLMAGIAAGILFTWQAITLHVQQFSVRPETETPVATVVRWVHTAWKAALPQVETAPPNVDPTFSTEQNMSRYALLDRWQPLIAQAAERFSIPAAWIRAVMQTESGGRTMSAAFKPITSRAGAMGLMQLMPGTYAQMRAEYGLGSNPYNPHDNVVAGVAYLRWLFHKYGYPEMFAAYNDGPGHLEERLMKGGLLPAETRHYVRNIVTELGGGTQIAGKIAHQGSDLVRFTRPNGKPVTIDLAQVISARASLPGEYAAGVHTVITIGHVQQGVCETYDEVKKEMISHGRFGLPVENASVRLAGLEVHAGSHRAETRHRGWRHARLALSGPRRVQVSYRESKTIRLHRLSRRVQS
jgi:soluble lytic murein transglycosylase-like protein